MKFPKAKPVVILIAIFLIISMGASLTLLPTANAHTPPFTYHTYAYIAVEPNPVGVGQTAYGYMWIDLISLVKR